MTDDMPNARFFAIAILILLATAWILIRYAKACRCDSCKDPYAIFGRGDLQLCRQCKIVYDRHRIRSLGMSPSEIGAAVRHAQAQFFLLAVPSPDGELLPGIPEDLGGNSQRIRARASHFIT